MTAPEFSIYAIPPKHSTEITQWLFTKEEINHSPSILEGMTKEHEQYLRESAILRLWKLKDILHSNQLVVETSAYYFHRFFMSNSFQRYDPIILATAAFYLASKFEEHHRRIRLVIGVTLSLAAGNKEPEINKKDSRVQGIDEDSFEFIEMRKRIIFYEEVLSRSLGYDWTIRMPHFSLLKGSEKVWEKGNRKEKETGKRIVETAWKFLNDSLSSTACLLYRPNVIAAASLVLACAFLRLPLPVFPPGTEPEEGEEELERPIHWIEIFQVTVEEIRDAVDFMSSYYVRAENEEIAKRAANFKLIETARELATNIFIPSSSPREDEETRLLESDLLDLSPSNLTGTSYRESPPLIITRLNPVVEAPSSDVNMADVDNIKTTSSDTLLSLPLSLPLSPFSETNVAPLQITTISPTLIPSPFSTSTSTPTPTTSSMNEEPIPTSTLPPLPNFNPSVDQAHLFFTTNETPFISSGGFFNDDNTLPAFTE